MAIAAFEPPASEDPGPSTLDLVLEHAGDGAIVRAQGRLDGVTVWSFRRRLLELLALPIASVTVDLGGADVGRDDISDVVKEVRAAAQARRVDLTLLLPGE